MTISSLRKYKFINGCVVKTHRHSDLLSWPFCSPLIHRYCPKGDHLGVSRICRVQSFADQRHVRSRHVCFASWHSLGRTRCSLSAVCAWLIKPRFAEQVEWSHEASELYDWGDWFESWRGHKLSQLKFFVVFPSSSQSNAWITAQCVRESSYQIISNSLFSNQRYRCICRGTSIAQSL
jgi:hypothetical protein